MRSLWMVGALVVACAPAQSSDIAPDDPQLRTACPPGEAPHENGCLPAGMQPDGCPAGEVPAGELTAGELTEGGGCRAAGIASCAEGFELDERGGCAAAMPDRPCRAGTLALPGESVCRPVASCGADRWGEIPIETGNHYVDATYAGGDSDGTITKPWTSIASAVAAVSPGETVAIAEGAYGDITIDGKNVRLWGRCPDLVVLGGIDVHGAAVELRGLSLTGGVVVDGASDVLVGDLWIHDTADYGVSVLGADAWLTLDNVLVEAAFERGIYVQGAHAAITDTVVRNTTASPLNQGRGINVRDDPATGERGSATIMRTLVEGSREVGIMVHASDVHLGSSVVRDTLPALDDRFGRCMSVQAEPATGERSRATIRDSLFERCRDGGLSVSGSDATVESTTVRDILPNLDGAIRGYGIATQAYASTGASRLTVVGSMFDRCSEAALFLTGSEVDIDDVAVVDSQPVMGLHGRGFSMQGDPMLGIPTAANIRRSRVIRGVEAGVYAQASKLVLEGVLVRGVAPRPHDGLYGRGATLQLDPDTGVPSDVQVRWSIFEGNSDIGVGVSSSSLLLESTLVRDTFPVNGIAGEGVEVAPAVNASELGHFELRWSVLEGQSSAGLFVASSGRIESSVVRRSFPVEGQFGDGIAVLAFLHQPHVDIVDTLIADSQRAAIATFGGTVALSQSTLSCNTMALVRQDYEGFHGAFTDALDNMCLCGQEHRDCKALESGGLTAPSPPEGPLGSSD
jgi:parallel beta helix pectate lyase-like protein